MAMDYFYDLKPPAVSVPPAGDGIVQGFASSFGPRLDAHRAAKADESRWQETLDAFPESTAGLTRAQMFALGRDPALRPYAIGLLTGRMKPEQPASGAQPRAPQPPPAFAPSRMATDADYQALPSGATYLAPDGSWRTKR
jgi:hypothetical protein